MKKHIFRWMIVLVVLLPRLLAAAYADEADSWDVARVQCEEMGGHLVTITSQEEQIFVESLNVGDLRLWIGGYRDDSFNWCWVTGEVWDYTNWGVEEPNNSGNVIANEYCVAIWPDYWNDLNSANIYEQSGYICEWEADSVENGILIPDDAALFEGNYYKIYTYPVTDDEEKPREYFGTWEYAKVRCEEMGGHLVTITSQEEQIFVESLNVGDLRLWIGGYRDDSFNWCWVTGEVWDYTNWGEGEPNNSGDEKYAAIWPAFWNDLNNANIHEQSGYICEWEADSVENGILIPGDAILFEGNYYKIYIPALEGTITDTGRSISLQEQIYINQYIKVSGFEGIDVAAKGGLLIWNSAVTEEEALYGTADTTQQGLIAYKDEYTQRTLGISARNYADELYLRIYIEVADDVYVYGPLVEYSVQDYCEHKIKTEGYSAELKQTCAALLHYGAMAQRYFKYNTNDLANANILEVYPAPAWMTED